MEARNTISELKQLVERLFKPSNRQEALSLLEFMMNNFDIDLEIAVAELEQSRTATYEKAIASIRDEYPA